MPKDTNFDAPRDNTTSRRGFLKGLAALFGAAAAANSFPDRVEAHSQPPPAELNMQNQAALLLNPDLGRFAIDRMEDPVEKVIASVHTVQHYTEYRTGSGIIIGVSLNETQDSQPLILNTRIAEKDARLTEEPAEFLARYYKPELLVRLTEGVWQSLPEPTLGDGERPGERKELVIPTALPDGSHISFAYINSFSPSGIGHRSIQGSILYPRSPYHQQRTAFQSAFRQIR